MHAGQSPVAATGNRDVDGGGSLPHVSGSPKAGALETDRLGRPHEWRRIHLIDASVFPTAAATTFTLTAMANAHRIDTSVSREVG